MAEEALTEDNIREALDALIEDAFDKEELYEVVREVVSEALSRGESPLDLRDALTQVKHDLMTALGEEREILARVDSLASTLDRVLSSLRDIERLVAYYEIPESREYVLSRWRLPEYLSERVMVLDEARWRVLEQALEAVERSENVAIIGEPGVGKTTMLYAVWSRLWDRTNVALLRDGVPLGRLHEERGYTLFFDDLPRSRRLAEQVESSGARMLVITARTAEWRTLPLPIRRMFTKLELPRMGDEALREVVTRHLDASGIEYGDEAVDEVVRRSKGLPVYAWMVVKELRSRGERELREEFARALPVGMIRYVSQILGSIVLEGDRLRPGGRGVLATLMCFTDMREYAVHADHAVELYYRVLEELRGPTQDKADPGLMARTLNYMSIHGHLYRLPHDSWADAHLGQAQGLVRPHVDFLRRFFRHEVRRRALRESARAAWENVVREFRSAGGREVDRLLSLAHSILLNSGPGDALEGAAEWLDEDLERALRDYADRPLARMVARLREEFPAEVAEAVLDPLIEEVRRVAERVRAGEYDLEELRELRRKIDGRLSS